jgi:hypothetical protein
MKKAVAFRDGHWKGLQVVSKPSEVADETHNRDGAPVVRLRLLLDAPAAAIAKDRPSLGASYR